MPTPLVECIPNFSEARRPEVVEAILAAITGVAEISLLNYSSDTDHNRSVVTFAGPPAAVEEAAFQAIRTAAGLIDLDQHSGSHPRLGATDVVPFVPISGISMEECVQMARRLGERVGQELAIPVYLYEAAATRPERTNLENIRRGQYEGLKTEIATNPERQPDFGPARLGPAGATVIGARHPLIAYQRLPGHGRCQHRQSHRQEDPPVLRRAAFGQGARDAGGRPGAGLDEPDEFPPDLRENRGGGHPQRSPATMGR